MGEAWWLYRSKTWGARLLGSSIQAGVVMSGLLSFSGLQLPEVLFCLGFGKCVFDQGKFWEIGQQSHRV